MDAGINIWVSFYMHVFTEPVHISLPCIERLPHNALTSWRRHLAYTMQESILHGVYRYFCLFICSYVISALIYTAFVHGHVCVCFTYVLDRNYLYSALLCVCFFPCVCVWLNDVLLCVRACVGVDVQVAVYKFECAYLFILVCVCMYAWNLRLLVSLITHNIYLI